MKHHLRLVVLSLLSLLVPNLFLPAQSIRNLAPHYREWIEAEVPYIISTDEKEQFLRLASDVERDQFIAAFWQSRNPDPNSEINTYKEEYYRRLAYVNANFGSEKYKDGWRTDMGRIYLTLGPPQQRAPYHLTANIRQMEIWFYQGNSPALPAYFYIVFYRRSPGEEYRLYSPRQDGPAEITSTGQRDAKTALGVVQKALGNEVARTLVSLNPSEPVDLDNPSPSMDSDLMLLTIRNLADNPLEREKRNLRRARERVTSSIVTTQADADLVTLVLRDSQGEYTLHELFRNGAPNPRLIGQRPDQTVGYDMTLHTVITTPSGQAVYQQQTLLTGKVTQPQAAVAAKKSFAAEDRLPLVPGTYQLEATLTNNLNLEALRWRDKVVVPDPKPNALSLSELLVYATPTRDTTGQLPFDFAALRFPPRALKTVAIHPGERVPLVFQIWLSSDASARTQPVHLHYLCGSVAAAGKPPVEFDEDVDTSNADAAGNLVTGHTLDTSALPVGTYRLIVRATQGTTPTPAYSTLTVRVVPPSTPTDLWTAYGAPADATANGSDNLKRGLAAEAFGQLDVARGFYATALRINSADQQALHHLATLLSRQGNTGALAALADQPIAKNPLDPSTLLLLAGALQKQGQAPRAIALITSQLKIQPPSASVYQALADLYRQAGDLPKAQDAQAHAQNIHP